MSHQLHITETFLTFVPIYKVHFIFREVKTKYVSILLAPFYTTWVTEEYKYWIFYIFPYMLDSSFEISKFITIAIASKHVTTAGVDSHRIMPIKESCHISVLRISKLRKNKRLPHLIFNFLQAIPNFLQ